MLWYWMVPGIPLELFLSADSQHTALHLPCLSVSLLFTSNLLPIYPRQLHKNKYLYFSNAVWVLVMEIQG